jgi:hypothetical protein
LSGTVWSRSAQPSLRCGHGPPSNETFETSRPNSPSSDTNAILPPPPPQSTGCSPPPERRRRRRRRRRPRLVAAFLPPPPPQPGLWWHLDGGLLQRLLHARGQGHRHGGGTSSHRQTGRGARDGLHITACKSRWRSLGSTAHTRRPGGGNGAKSVWTISRRRLRIRRQRQPRRWLHAREGIC